MPAFIVAEAGVEKWCPVVGYEGLYEVSSYGVIRSLPRRRTAGRALIPIRGSRYHYVNLTRPGGQRKQFTVHRLVLEAFVGPRPEGKQACHNDGNPLHNALINLRWDTVSANNLDKREHGTAQRGERNGMATLSEHEVRVIRACRARGESGPYLARKFKVDRATIYNIEKRRTWAHL